MAANADILVTGATGNVGEEVVRRLAESGIPARAAVRDVDSARERWGDAITCVPFDFENPDTHRPALQGSTKLFLVRPPAIADVKQHLFPVIDAAAAAGVEHVVFLSLLGVERNPLVPHRKVEQHIRTTDLRFTFLRAGFFMQNLSTTHRREIRDRNRIFVPAGRGRTSFVDVRDIAAVAVAALTEDGHDDTCYDLTGDEALTYAEVADILSDVLGRRIVYADPSIPAFWWKKRSEGHPFPMVAVMTALYTITKLGLAGRVADGVHNVLGRPPISFRAFAADYRDCWVPE